MASAAKYKRENSTDISSDSVWTTILEAGSPGPDGTDGAGSGILEVNIQKISGDTTELRVYPGGDKQRGAGTPDTYTLDGDRTSMKVWSLSGIAKITAKLASGGSSSVVRHTVLGTL